MPERQSRDERPIEQLIVEHDLAAGSLLRQTQAELERERIHRREVQAVREQLDRRLDEALSEITAWKVDLAEARAAIEAEGHERVSLEIERDQLRDLIGTLWLYTGRRAEVQLTTDQKELFADVVEVTSDDPEFHFDRWWRITADLKVHPAGSPGNPPFTQPMDDPPDTRDDEWSH